MFDEWIKAQQQYWRSVEGMLGAQPAASGPADATRGTDAWWRMWRDAAAAPAMSGFGPFPGDHGPRFAFAEPLRALAELLLRDSGDGPDIAAAITRVITDLRAAAAALLPPSPGTAEAIAFLGWPVEAWRRALVDAELLGAGGAGPGDPAALWSSWASGPSLGPGREWQVRLKALHRCLMERQHAARELLAEQARIAQLGVERLAARFTGDEARQGRIGSLKEFYDLWVDCGEAAYREIVMTDRYTSVFGRFVNTSMQTRKLAQELRDDLLASQDLPNRRELNTIIERQHTLHKELVALRAVNPEGMRRLHARVEILSGEIEALRADVGTLHARLTPRRAPAENAPRVPPRAAKPRAAKPSADKPHAVKPRPPRLAAGRTGEFDIARITDHRDPQS